MKLQRKTIFDGQIERLSKFIEDSDIFNSLNHRFFNKWNMNVSDLAWNMFNRADIREKVDYQLAWYAGNLYNTLIEQGINIFWNSFIYEEVKDHSSNGNDFDGLQFFKDKAGGSMLKTGLSTGVYGDKGQQLISGILTAMCRFLAPSPKKGCSAFRGKWWADDISSIVKQIEKAMKLGFIGMNPNLDWRRMIKARRAFDNEVLVSVEFEIQDLYAVSSNPHQLHYFMMTEGDKTQFAKALMVALKITLWRLSTCSDDAFTEAKQLLGVTEDLTQKDCEIMNKNLFGEKLGKYTQEEISSALGSWIDPLKLGIRKKYYEHMYNSIYPKGIKGLRNMTFYELQTFGTSESLNAPKRAFDFVSDIRKDFNSRISSLSKKRRNEKKLDLLGIFQKVIKSVMIDGFMKEVQAEHDKWAKMI